MERNTTTFVTRKSRLSSGVLNCVEESVYKKQRRGGGPKGRFAWRQKRQVLWERGLYAEAMSASADAPAE